MTGYRVVVEALTNVRRHAPGATRVGVSVAASGPALTVTVTNDGGTANEPAGRALDRSGGFGLIGLRERIEALGGTLTAGPHDADGWRVIAVLPLTA